MRWLAFAVRFPSLPGLMETSPDLMLRLQPEDKQAFLKIASLLIWVIGLMVLVVAGTS